MKFSILIFIFTCFICEETNTQQEKRAFLIETDMTREELENLINQEEAAKFEEGKLAASQIEIESEDDHDKDDKDDGNDKDDKDDKDDRDNKDDNEKKVETQKEVAKTALIKKNNIPTKISLFNYVVAFLIVVILLQLYLYGSKKRLLMKERI